MVDARKEVYIKCCKFTKYKLTICTVGIREGFSEEAAFALGLEIVVRLGNGVEGGRTFQEGEVKQKWTNRKKRFCSGHSKLSNFATWGYKLSLVGRVR